MRAQSLFALTVTGLWILACGSGEEPAAENGDTDAEDPQGGEVGPGEIHVEYPTAALDAEPGQFVLAPSREFLDRVLKEGSGGFIWYAGELLEAGEVESKVKSLAGTEFTIPNTLIIPIDKGYEASVNDVLLGHWESGSGMRRAFVTGGSPTEPTVRYLERAYDKEHEAEQKEDTFEPNRFHALTRPWQIGTTVACGEDTDRDHGILVHDAGERILVSGFAGKVEAKDRSECVSLPPRQRFEEGETAWVPVVGSYTEGKVSRFEKAVGRVWVTYTWGGAEREEAFPIVDVAKNFEGSDPGQPDRAGRRRGQGGGEGARGGGGGRQGGARGEGRRVRKPGN